MKHPHEITRFAKGNGPLTKHISLAPDGRPKSDGSACVMGRGVARRTRLANMAELAACIGGLASSEAIALGALRSGLPEQVEIVTKRRLDEMNGAAMPSLIARMAGEILYRPSQPALALLDFDMKGMPGGVDERIERLGGFWPALLTVIPELANAARVTRRSTSAGLYHTESGERFSGSGGLHVFVSVADGADVERFLKTLHDRCWLAGFGWMMVGAAGQLLERSIIDRMVAAPERLVFEGAPVVIPPLAQDHNSRIPVACEGDALDTVATCPPLTILETAKLGELRAKEAHRLAPESVKARDGFIKENAKRLTERTGKAGVVASLIIGRQCEGILRPEIVLPFDDPELTGITVRDVLADPARYEGTTLADPLEGPDYGRGKAKIMRRADGTPWIHSFAHGRTVYELMHDAAAVRAAIEQAPKDEVANAFVRLALVADLDEAELDELRNLAADRAGIGRRVMATKLSRARQTQAQQRAREEHNREAAERKDPRPRIKAPAPDAPWLPQMQLLNDVLGKSTAPEPPMRDVEGFITQVRVRHVPTMHALTASSSNEGEASENRMPAPEQPLLTRLDEMQLAEIIERHVEFVDHANRPVHLAAPFVKHFQRRSDGALPTVCAVTTLPIVMPDGTILSGSGLNRERGIVFRVPRALERLLPDARKCTPSAVARAMRFLTDEWLVDVATDYPGKCVLIAIAATILERLVLPQRPAFFITAGQRGGGKSTAANMIAVAALGQHAAAAAWSPNDEERRKSLFAYLGEGVPLIYWDNIPRGAAISCPSIEKSLTAASYTDRVLGASDTRTVPATAIHVFTGNNVAPRGDLASRSFTARLAVERPDPENRPFRHLDPIGWTQANRGQILSAIYTILLGNPGLRSAQAAAQTRFKEWHVLVGSAIEHAAGQHASHAEALVVDVGACVPAAISFKEIIAAGEADEEQTSGLATVLDVFRGRWPAGASAAQVAAYAGEADGGAIEFKSAIEQASGKPIKVTTATVISWRLKALTDAPVRVGNSVLALRMSPDKQGASFTVRIIP